MSKKSSVKHHGWTENPWLKQQKQISVSLIKTHGRNGSCLHNFKYLSKFHLSLQEGFREKGKVTLQNTCQQITEKQAHQFFSPSYSPCSVKECKCISAWADGALLLCTVPPPTASLTSVSTSACMSISTRQSQSKKETAHINARFCVSCVFYTLTAKTPTFSQNCSCLGEGEGGRRTTISSWRATCVYTFVQEVNSYALLHP